MTLFRLLRLVALRPNLISCGSGGIGYVPHQRSLTAAGCRPVSRHSETNRTGTDPKVTLYESMGYSVLQGTGQDETRMIRTPPFTSRFHAPRFHICWGLEKWRGVRGEPFAACLAGRQVAP